MTVSHDQMDVVHRSICRRLLEIGINARPQGGFRASGNTRSDPYA
jgi:hypothetical protein